MSLPRNAIIWLVLWLIWTILAYPMCLKDCCTGDAVVENAIGQADDRDTADDIAQQGVITFSWSNAEPIVGDGLESFKNRILSQQSNDNILEITGLYYEGETNSTDAENLGLARAGMVNDLLASGLSADRLNIRSRAIAATEGVRDRFFEGVEFLWIEPEEKEAATVEELDDRRIVRFPFSSIKMEVDPEVDVYLDKLAERVKQTGEKIRLVGHSDGIGGEEDNRTLSDRRAKEIRDILRTKGVSEDQITIEAKGESQPVASNSTEAGRRDNRRVEIFLIKN